MSIDLTPLDLRELNTLIRAAQDRHKALTQRQPAEKVRRKLTALAKQTGYTIEELFGPGADAVAPKGKAGRRKGPKVKPMPKAAPINAMPLLRFSLEVQSAITA